MNSTTKIMGVAAALCLVAVTGCGKTVAVTVWNHSADPLDVKITTPDGTRSVGAVGANSRLSHKVTVRQEDFPAQCSVTAGLGNSKSFTVDENSDEEVWFHVSKAGALTGPYGEDDVYTETEKEIDVHKEVGRDFKIQ